MSREKDRLRELSKNWTYQPVDKKVWIEKSSVRLGVRPADIEKAFDKEFATPQELWETLEVPDVMKVTYKFSYGGQSPFFRALRDYGRLLGAKCEACNFVYCPPRKNCSKCYGDTQWVELPGTGRVETFTTVHKGTSAIAGREPFVCAYIRLDESDFVVMANIEMANPRDAAVGMRVKIEMKKDRSGSVVDFFFTLA